MSSQHTIALSGDCLLGRYKEPSSRSPTQLSQAAAESIYSQSQYSKSSESTSASSMNDIELPRLLNPGILVPLLAFFLKASEDLDLRALTRHVVRLAKAGIAGFVTQGSTGEAVHLTHQERKLVTQITRKALDDAGFHALPIIVGCGSESTRETIELCHEASDSGGDYALVLPPSFYKPLYRSDSLVEFFNDVADASPIPILIYNFPAAVGGIDMDSDVITQLSEHPKIVGCKLTCGNTGKLARVAAAVNATTPTETNSGFMCMAGSADFALQGLVVGGSGVICGLGNLSPKACVKLVDLCVAGKLKEAKKLQAVVARGDGAQIRSGVVGLKSALETYYGYGGIGRKPLPRPTKGETMRYAKDFKELIDLEKSL